MFLADSRSPHAAGVLPLQDHGYISMGVDVSDRACLLACRIVGRDTRGEGLGHWRYEDDDDARPGDIVGAFAWPPEDRPMPGWSWIFPVRVVPTKRPTTTPSEQTTPRETKPPPAAAITAAGSGPNYKDDIPLQPPGTFAPMAIDSTAVVRPNNADARAAPISPPGAAIEGDGVGGDVAGPSTGKGAIKHTGGPARGAFPPVVRPLAGRALEDATEYRTTVPDVPADWPRFPGNFHGIVVAGTDVDQQTTYFFPTDPRIVCPNANGPGDTGSMVVDLSSKSMELDTTRIARVQSFWRVLRGASRLGNSLAWQLGLSGLRDTRGGYVIDAVSKGKGLGTATTQRPNRNAGRLPPDEGGRLQIGIPVTGSGAEGGIGGWGQQAQGGSRRDGGSGALVVALASIADGGPLDVGGTDDKHSKGRDLDGHPINSLHISTEALFRNRDKPSEDGPLHFEDKFRDGQDFLIKTKVHLAFDASGTQHWRWWSSTLVGLDTPPNRPPPPTITPSDPDPPPPPPPPIPPDERGPITPSDPAGPIDPSDRRGRTDRGGPIPMTREPHAAGGSLGESETWWSAEEWTPRFISGTKAPWEFRRGAVTPYELSAPALAFRPQLLRVGARDWRYHGLADEDEFLEDLRRTPTVLRLAAWGAQGGEKAGPYLTPPTTGSSIGAAPWNYAQQPGASRSSGGTAAGGLALLPPEVDLEDIDRGFAPDGITPSEVGLVATPRTFLGWGTPELAAGGLKSGWSSRVSENGTLIFGEHNATGARSDRFTLGAGGIPQFSVESGIVASTTHVQGQRPLTMVYNEITTANAGDVVTLPAAQTGRMIILKNSASATVNVYPAAGNKVDGLALDTPFSLPSLGIVVLFATSATQWYRLIGA
jgi:hypothetical protein